MSLALALAIVGGLVLAALIAHSAWTARKASVKRPSRNRHRRSNAVSLIASSRHSSRPRRTSDTPPASEPRALRRRANARLDALIDAIAPLTLEAPVSAELAMSHLPPTRRAGSKPFMIEGLNAENGEWEPITLGQRYGEFQAGVQLANRSRRAQRDRVLRVRAEDRSVRRAGRRDGRLSGHARRGGAGTRARQLRERSTTRNSRCT